MSYSLTDRMKLAKPDPNTQQAFQLTQYNGMLDKIDTLAGVTAVATLSAAPTDNLYDGRIIITRNTNNVYVYNWGLSIWQQANIQQPAQLTTSQVATVTTAQRNLLSKINLLDGTVIFNLTTNKMEIYKISEGRWYDTVGNVTFSVPDPVVGGSAATINFISVGTESTVNTYAAGSGFGTKMPFNQRKIDRTSNGVAWTCLGSGDLKYSTDGINWVSPANALSAGLTGSASFYIDIDDYAHIAFINSSDNKMYYSRGTPNIGRTNYVWSTPVGVWTSTQYAISPDIVAHRDPDSSGWIAHIAHSMNQTGANNYGVWYVRIAIDASGNATNVSGNVQIGTGGSGAEQYPSIDFRHTGDGRTVQVQPDIFISWSTNTGGGGSTDGTRFRKGTYSAGNWTWGTNLSLAGLRFTSSNNFYWFNSFYDGTRFVMVACTRDGTGSNAYFNIWERDLADTTTTTRVDITLTNGAFNFYFGCAGYDGNGNIYIFGLNTATGSNGTYPLTYTKWTRSSATFSAQATLDTTGYLYGFMSMKRAYTGGKLDFVWIDGVQAGPWPVKANSLAGITGIQNTLGATSTLASTSAGTPTMYSNSRKMDRCQNGVMWEIGPSGASDLRAFYSTDNGATWTVDPTTLVSASAASWSVFIDVDDYAHVVYKVSSGIMYYMRGTPNLARTTYTWTGATSYPINSGTSIYDLPDIIAHRDPNVAGAWNAHVVMGNNSGGGSTTVKVVYCKIDISATQAITVNGVSTIGATLGTANAQNSFPSIDFRHNGDGKTAALVSGALKPDLFVVWASGAYGSAATGMRIIKGAYATGAWTWGTDTQLTTDGRGSFVNWHSVLFDGTRVTSVCMAGGISYALYQFDIDPDTMVVTSRTLVSFTTAANTAYIDGSYTYDSNGNLYIFYQTYEDVTTSRTFNYRRWVRTTTTFEAAIQIDTTVERVFSNARRGYKSYAGQDQIDFVWSDAITNAPVRFAKIT